MTSNWVGRTFVCVLFGIAGCNGATKASLRDSGADSKADAWANTGGTLGSRGTSRDASISSGGRPGSGGITGSGGVVSVGGALGAGGRTESTSPETGGRVSSGGNGGGNVALNGGAPSGGATSTCTGCQSLEQCWNGHLCVAKSVPLAAGFSVDATEVTRAQYAAWLATSPSPLGQPDVCSWNDSFAPNAICMAGTSVCQNSACTNHPQPCIDLCDAIAYCRTVGKRLCGGISGSPALSRIDATKSQWFNACSSNGTNDFTYGSSLVWGNCNDYTASGNTTVPVGTLSKCQSSVAGYAGIFDLIGNLQEWEDNCDGSAGQTDTCRPRGGSFGIGAALQSCTQVNSAQRSTTIPTLGFRCCAP